MGTSVEMDFSFCRTLANAKVIGHPVLMSLLVSDRFNTTKNTWREEAQRKSIFNKETTPEENIPYFHQGQEKMIYLLNVSHKQQFDRHWTTIILIMR